MMKNIIRDKSGAALFTALIIIVLVATLATALFAYASNSILAASAKEDTKQIEFLARSGIESAIKAWEYIPGQTEKLTTYPVYLKSDGTYRDSLTETIKLEAGEIGYYIVEIEPKSGNLPQGAPSDLVQFTSKAYVNGREYTKKAYVIESESGIVNTDWIDDKGHLITKNLHPNDNTYKLADKNGDPAKTASTFIKENKDYPSMLWGSCTDDGEKPCTLDHTLIIDKHGVEMLNINDNQHCFFLGKTIIFNMGINFTSKGKKIIDAIIFSAADIYIDGEIYLEINATGGEYINTVILKTHPAIEKYLYDVDVGDGVIKKMGRVTFNDNVYCSYYDNKGKMDKRVIITGGTSFYFNGIDNNGFDLMKYAADCRYYKNGYNNLPGIASHYTGNLGGLGATYYGKEDKYLRPYDDDDDIMLPLINTTRLIIWQN
jgi:hypothetical protein